MKLLQQLFQSKKFIAMLIGVIGVIILKVFKVQVDPETIAVIIAPIVAYILGQGWADSGKEAAKIHAVSLASNNMDKATPEADKAVRAIAEELK